MLKPEGMYTESGNYLRRLEGPIEKYLLGLIAGGTAATLRVKSAKEGVERREGSDRDKGIGEDQRRSGARGAEIFTKIPVMLWIE